jgi:glutamine synthetase
MNGDISEFLEFVKVNDVKFIRLAFCDLLGSQKNISVMRDNLSGAFTGGVAFDGSSVTGFAPPEKSDLLLFPDASAFAFLPWRPQQGRVARLLCDIRNPDGTDYPCDTRAVLRRASARAAALNFEVRTGVESAFYLFKTDETGAITRNPLDNGGYLDIAPLDKGENVRREICLALEEMGIEPETSHHERGPGQNEINFACSPAAVCADRFLAFKSVVKAIAARNGLFASFLPKPLTGAEGSGLHVNLSLWRDGRNLFALNAPEANAFMAGVLRRLPEITAFLNPIDNSYSRIRGDGIPRAVAWGGGDRTRCVRVPAPSSSDAARFELRTPDAALNPYIAFALIIHAGLDGIEKKSTFSSEGEILPETLSDALSLARKSAFVKANLPAEYLERYFKLKKGETERADPDGERFFRLL